MNRTSSWVFVFVIFIGGCRQNSADQHGHEHKVSGLQPLTYTLYSDKTELFVEFKPLVVGSVTRFATHLTALGETFTPITRAKVTVSLILEDKGFRMSVDSANSPGIFRLALKPSFKGKGRLVFDIASSDYTDQIVIENVTVYPDQLTALQSQSHDHADEEEIIFLKEQAWKVPFSNVPVIKEKFQKVIRTTGYVESAPGDEVVISARSNGIVRLSNPNLTTGISVAAGQKMFVLSGGDVAQGNIDASYQEATAIYNTAKLNYERAQELMKDKIISEKDYLNVKVTYENAAIRYNMIGKGYGAEGQSNSASISGYIKNIHVIEGQYVTAGTPLATITKNRKLLLNANLSQKYFRFLPIIRSANFRMQGSDNVYCTTDLNGRAVSYGKSTRPGAAFMPVIFEVDNTGELVPGASLEFFLKSAPIPNAIVIPVEALMEEQGNFYVYVQTGGESFQKRDITVGETDGKKVQVFSGLVTGDRVVTKGAYQLKLSTASGELPDHGHEH